MTLDNLVTAIRLEADYQRWRKAQLEWLTSDAVNRLATRQEFIKSGARVTLTPKLAEVLFREHGWPTHYSQIEGGEWRDVNQSIFDQLFRIQPHALRFIDGREWDEINGIRPIDSQD